MQAKITSFQEWQQHFSDEKSCLQAITKQRWPEGFCCPKCQYNMQTRHVFECADCHHHTPDLVDEWLPWVHIIISNFKSYLLGTYHRVSGQYVQEYLDEFCYRLNRRFWEDQIPNRLLRICIGHKPIFLKPVVSSQSCRFIIEFEGRLKDYV